MALTDADKLLPEYIEKKILMDRLKVQIGNRVSGYNRGYLVTVDSPWTTYNSNINLETLYGFGNKQLREINDLLHHYCFPKFAIKNKRLLRTVAAIEIGKTTRRLHAHMVLLHHGEVGRTASQINTFLKDSCQSVMNMSGKSATHVKPFELRRDWVGYFVKSTEFMKSQYGYMNVECY